MLKERYLHKPIVIDLQDKTVFIGGPRQVGKTTLARLIGRRDYKRFGYFNWDNRQDRKKVLDGGFEATDNLLIFDEIHKYRPWKSYRKGLYDTHEDQYDIIATGSARLDVYRRGGDSLMGRYRYYRLHPFSLAEVLEIDPLNTVPHKPLWFPDVAESKSQRALQRLRTFGGFPEVWVNGDAITLRRFQNERIDRLIREDVRDLENIRDLSALQVLAEILPTKVGSRLSLNSLREDLDVAHKTVALWVDVLERLYYHYRVYPYTGRLVRTVRKEPKLYLWDWSEVEQPGARFENIVASHLLKFTHYLHDTLGFKAELRYWRDHAGREVDFIVTVNNRPWFAVEAKETDTAVSPSLVYLSRRLAIPELYQVVWPSGVDVRHDPVRVMSADRFFSALV